MGYYASFSRSHNHSSPPRERRARSLSPSNTRVSAESRNLGAQPNDAILLAQLFAGARTSAHDLLHEIPKDSSLVHGGCQSSSGFADPLSVQGDVKYAQSLSFSSDDFPWHLLLSQYQDYQTHPDQFKQTQGDSSTASSSSQPHTGPSLPIHDINPSDSGDLSFLHATTSASPSTAGTDSAQTDFDHAIAEEKRRRNTEASARFRIKRKQRTLNLERTISDLTGRAKDLEREAADLRRENGWLKEIVVLKGRQLAVENIMSDIMANGAHGAAEQSSDRRKDDDITDAKASKSKRKGEPRKK